jgi:glycosyltransferase involved in cell wall biosynthesis
MSPKVSIITPLHNKGPYIAETIASVLNQSLTDWEMIIVENGSADHGPDVVRTFQDSRIRLIISDVRGPGAARNHGLSLAQGEWILFLDADDLMEPAHLSHLLKVAESNPSCGIIAGGWKSFEDGHDEELKEHHPHPRNHDRDSLLAGALSLTPWIVHAVIVRKDLLTPERQWPAELDSFPDEDTAFWFPLILATDVAWSSESGAIYRLSTPNSRSSLEDLQKRFAGYEKILAYNMTALQKSGLRIAPRAASQLSMMYEGTYRKALLCNDKKIAAIALQKATYWLGKSPSSSLNIIIRKIFGISTVNTLKKSLQKPQI